MDSTSHHLMRLPALLLNVIAIAIRLAPRRARRRTRCECQHDAAVREILTQLVEHVGGGEVDLHVGFHVEHPSAWSRAAPTISSICCRSSARRASPFLSDYRIAFVLVGVGI